MPDHSGQGGKGAAPQGTVDPSRSTDPAPRAQLYLRRSQPQSNTLHKTAPSSPATTHSTLVFALSFCTAALTSCVLMRRGSPAAGWWSHATPTAPLIRALPRRRVGLEDSAEDLAAAAARRQPQLTSPPPPVGDAAERLRRADPVVVVGRWGGAAGGGRWMGGPLQSHVDWTAQGIGALDALDASTGH